MLRFDPPHGSSNASFYTPLSKRRGDITVHFDELLSSDEQKAVEESLSNRQGVERIQFQPHHPHLAIIYYDVFLTSTKQILQMLNSDCLFPFHVNDGIRPEIHVQLVGL
jgi:hypothetical protein